MKVYFISGLAADKRVFKYIALPEGYEIVHLDWIDPQPGESLHGYSLRLAQKIDRSQPFILLGLSMGGMIASEIATEYNPVQTILISSIVSANQLPVYFKWAGRIRLHRLVPIRLVKSAAIMKRLFTAETPDDKETLKAIIRDSNPRFIRWAIDAILKWEMQKPPEHIIHIHGTRDEVLPIRFVKPTHRIERGGHLMVMNHYEEINRILAGQLCQ